MEKEDSQNMEQRSIEIPPDHGQQSVTVCHWTDDKGNPKMSEHRMVTASSTLLRENHYICLINSVPEKTDFEDIPIEVLKWALGLNFSCGFNPCLARFWREPEANHKSYAYTLNIEVPNPRSDNMQEEDFCIDYDAQLVELVRVVREISVAIPQAYVRLIEYGGNYNHHCIEISYGYRQSREHIYDGICTLENRFMWVWNLGQKPSELSIGLVPRGPAVHLRINIPHPVASEGVEAGFSVDRRWLAKLLGVGEDGLRRWLDSYNSEDSEKVYADAILQKDSMLDDEEVDKAFKEGY